MTAGNLREQKSIKIGNIRRNTMSLQRFCERSLITISPEQTVVEACQRLYEKNVGCLLAVENGRLKGILTDRDIALKVTREKKDAQQTKVRDVMTPNPIAISVNRKLSDLTTLMHAHHVRRVPIIDTNDAVIGLVTLDDLLVLLSNEMVDMRETVTGTLFSKPAPVEHLEATLPLEWITSYL
jgi:CBS domain-containing protein